MRVAWLGALGIFAAAGAAWWLPSCGNTPACTDASCQDSSAAPPISGGGCDSSKPPSQGGCAVADVDGFFVSPSGSDGADGSKATPFKTIGKGITAAAGAPTKPNVYICAGMYPENLTIQNAPQGVALHGGFSCADWSPSGGTSAVAPAYVPNSTTPQYVLRVIGTAALVESLTLTAPDATDPGVSSIAAFVDTSPGMTFRRANVTAGKGADGASPSQVPAIAANKAGNNASNQTAGLEQKCNCATDFTVGGAGGYYDAGVVPGAPGLPVINGVDAGMPSGSAGGNGANGPDQTGANSTNVLGELTSNGWTPSSGGPGAAGGTAQGGAGGACALGNLFGGSSGGCGGCGGSGGAGGGGGGASIAVTILNTTLRVQASTLHGGAAGNGGNGAPGQPGQPGGAGGSTNFQGGAGGTGGAGGGGGGGAGGVSLGIAAVNTTPDTDTQSSVLGGKAGTGGNNGAVPPTSKATDGVAEAFHTF